MINPDLILVGDIHITENVPICRTDDYLKTLERKMKWLNNIQKKYNCPIIAPGDLLEYWKPSPELISWCLDHLPDNLFTIAGNHDLPAHNLELLKKSGLTTLSKAKKVHLMVGYLNAYTFTQNKTNISLYPFSWKVPLQPWGDNKLESFNIAVCHKMVYKSTLPWPGCQADSAIQLLKKLSGYDLVLTGDNHQSFYYSGENGILVNPGSFTRSTSDQKKHKPCIYLWKAPNILEKVFVPIEQGVITDDHIVSKLEKEQKSAEFIQNLKEDHKTTSSFKENLTRYFDSNRTREAVQKLTWECLEKET